MVIRLGPIILCTSGRLNRVGSFNGNSGQVVNTVDGFNGNSASVEVLGTCGISRISREEEALTRRRAGGRRTTATTTTTRTRTTTTTTTEVEVVERMM